MLLKVSTLKRQREKKKLRKLFATSSSTKLFFRELSILIYRKRNSPFLNHFVFSLGIFAVLLIMVLIKDENHEKGLKISIIRHVINKEEAL